MNPLIQLKAPILPCLISTLLGCLALAPLAQAKEAFENPALQPYQVEDDIGVISPNGNFKTASFDVPAGKRLVIELVTIWAALEAGQTFSDVRVNITKIGGSRLTFRLTPTPVGTSAGCAGCGVFIVTQPLQLYCEAGTGALQVQTERTGSTGLYSTRFSVSGHLVDVP
jgi:hypothetical protein